MGDQQGRTCRACGAGWRDPAARFCGRCGAVLPHGRGAAAGPSGTTSPVPSGRRRWLAGAAALAVIGGAVLIGVASTTVEETPVAPGDVEVALPDPQEVPRRPPRPPEAIRVPIPAQVTCDPTPCARWQVHLNPGATIPMGGLLLHSELEGRPAPGAGAPADEATVTALATDDGSVVWRRNVTVARPGGWPGSRLLTVHTSRSDHPDLILLPNGPLLIAMEVTGQQRWAVDVGGPTVAATGTPDGDVVVEVRPGPTRALLRLAGDDGTVRWRTEVANVLAVATTHAVVTPSDGRGHAGVDLTTGEVTPWSRDLPRPPVQPPVPLAADRLAVVTPEAIELVDAATGEPVTRRPLPGGAIDTVDAVGVDGALRAVGLDPSPPATTDGWFSAARGLVVVRHGEQALELLALDGDGAVVWERTLEVAPTECCWDLQFGGDAATVVVTPPPWDPQPAHVLSTADGRTVRSIELPTDLDGAAPWIAWVGEIAVTRAASTGVMSLWFPGGTVHVDRTVTIIALDPVPVIQVGATLVGLDPHLLGPDGGTGER